MSKLLLSSRNYFSLKNFELILLIFHLGLVLNLLKNLPQKSVDVCPGTLKVIEMPLNGALIILGTFGVEDLI